MLEALISLVITTTALLGSPGPATLGLAAVGATFGIKKGLPFLLGILCGLSVVIVATILGVATLLSQFPFLRAGLQILGGLYIVYVAFKIATAPVGSDNIVMSRSQPRFVDGFMLNLLNPKAYAAFLALFSQFLLPFQSPLWAFTMTAMVCYVIAIILDGLWLVLGGLLKPLFTKAIVARMIRILFALSMLISVVWAFFIDHG